MKNPGDLAVQPPEQTRYAKWLDWGTRVGLGLLLLSFGAYVMGLAESHVPVSRLPELWIHPVARFVELTDTPTGWGWLALVPLYMRRGDRTFAAVCLAEVVVVLLAASGWLPGGR